MANIPLGDIASILEENLFDDGNEFRLAVANEFRHLAAKLVRNALSKSIIKAGTADPEATDLVEGLTQYYINTTSKARFISVAGAAWVNVTPDRSSSTPGDDGEDGWSPIFSIESDSNRRVIKVIDWAGGGGTKPAINQYLSASGFDSDISNGVDIRGIQGLRGLQGIPGGDGNDGDNAWNPVFAIEADNARRVVKIVDWTGGGGTKPDINKYLGTSGYVDDIANGVDIRGAAGEDGDDSTAPQETLAIGEVTRLGSWDIRSTASPTAGQIGIGNPNTNLKIHDTDADSTDQSTAVSTLKIGDQLLFGTTHLFQVTSAAIDGTNEHTVGGVWLKGDPTDTNFVGAAGVSVWFLPSHRAIQPGAVKQFHLENNSVGLAQLAHGTPHKVQGWDETGAPAEVDLPEEGTTQVGRVTSIGSYTAQGGDSFGLNGRFFDSDDDNSSPELAFTTVNRANEDKESVFREIEEGDYIIIEGVNVLEVESVTIGSGTPKPVQVSGTWVFEWGSSDTTSNSNYSIYTAKRNDYIQASNVLQGDTLLGLDANLQVEYVPRGLSGQGDGDGSSTEIKTGIYEDLGEWTWVSTSSPVAGQFYVEAGEIRIFDTNTGGTSRASELTGVALGDRFQFGDVNAFEVTSVGVEGGNTYWGFAGVWADPFVIGDFNGDYTIRHIKKDSVLVRNTAVKQAFLKLDDNLQVISHDPADSLDVLWSGSASTGATYSRALNAGKKFSDYKNIIFEFNGTQRSRAQSIPRSVFVDKEYIEISNRAYYLDIRYRSDTAFSVAGGHSGLTLSKVYGQKGV